MHIDYNKLPEHMRDGFRLYIERGVPGGSFMTAVLSNNLMAAMQSADDVNRKRIFDICLFLYNQAPLECWGSSEMVDRWVERGGLQGKDSRVSLQPTPYDAEVSQ